VANRLNISQFPNTNAFLLRGQPGRRLVGAFDSIRRPLPPPQLPRGTNVKTDGSGEDLALAKRLPIRLTPPAAKAEPSGS